MAKKSAPKKRVVKSQPARSGKARTVKTVSATPKTEQKAAPSKSSDTVAKVLGAKQKHHEELPFGRMNYILLVIGIVIIGFGFFLMSLEDFVDASEFSIALYIAPIVVVGGFVEVIFAIMYHPKADEAVASES